MPLVDVFCYFQQCAVASEVVALCSVIFFAFCVKSLMSSLHSFASRPCFHGAFNDTIIPGFHSAAFHVHLSSQRDVTSIACLHCFFLSVSLQLFILSVCVFLRHLWCFSSCVQPNLFPLLLGIIRFRCQFQMKVYCHRP